VDTLSLTLEGGFRILVPASLGTITTYVLLEQETWFEKELIFLDLWLKPGMTVIDIGANFGVYALKAAMRVGPEGRVHAYEPGTEARAFLEKSRDANNFSWLRLHSAALSDTRREGFLFHGMSAELHSLSGEGEGEVISITTLDAEGEREGWRSPDFVKIDAEGEELRILLGGESFFSRHSPLVMFEMKAEDSPRLDLPPAFSRLGYRVYRASGDGACLVPFEPGEETDVFELNLFAAKEDLAARLAGEGLLVEQRRTWIPDDAARTMALTPFKAFAFARAFPSLFASRSPIDPLYRDALAGFAVWQNKDLPLSTRWAALQFSRQRLADLCATRPSLARLSTFSRVSWQAGRRYDAVRALYAFSGLLQRGVSNVDEPFWPANPRFDAIDPGTAHRDWFIGGTLEQLVKAERFSSVYGPSPVDLAGLETLAFASPEISRRRVLFERLSGRSLAVPESLQHRTPGHMNAEIWSAGLPLSGVSS